jgi:hypothetical protein
VHSQRVPLANSLAKVRFPGFFPVSQGICPWQLTSILVVFIMFFIIFLLFAVDPQHNI